MVIKSIKKIRWSRSFMYQITSAGAVRIRKQNRSTSCSVRLFRTNTTEQEGQKPTLGHTILEKDGISECEKEINHFQMVLGQMIICLKKKVGLFHDSNWIKWLF